MHTIIADLCTGCELCIAPCPVDCIVMIPVLKSVSPALSLPDPDESRARYAAHTARITRRAAERAATLAAKKRGARPAR
jgi:electron transport complex protein RnfB